MGSEEQTRDREHRLGKLWMQRLRDLDKSAVLLERLSTMSGNAYN